MAVDWNFIRELEGFSSQGYVPVDKQGNPIGHSGVTIGMGFDLGQQTKVYINYLAGSPLSDKLYPYCGLIGKEALNYLKQHPLSLTANELNSLFLKVEAKYEQDLAKLYNANSSTDFESLDDKKQTVFASVAYQYGDIRKKCPKFFNLACHGMWQDVVTELRNFGDAFSSRRNKEADLLQSSL